MHQYTYVRMQDTLAHTHTVYIIHVTGYATYSPQTRMYQFVHIAGMLYVPCLFHLCTLKAPELQ